MSDTPPAAPAAEDAANRPSLSLMVQYVKDLSFESPNAPMSLAGQAGTPNLDLGVDVAARRLTDEQFEVVLTINARAYAEEQTYFIAELSYGAVWAFRNIPEEQFTPILFTECPRLMYPFARRVISDVTRDGGFPPLVLDPVDFIDLLRRKQEQEAAGEFPAANIPVAGNA